VEISTDMFSISGYQIKETLYESKNLCVCRAIDEATRNSVILKILRGESPEPSAVARFRREFEILRDLNIEGVIKVYRLEKHSKKYAIIMEDLGGDSLEKILKERKLYITKFIELAIKISEILGEIHQHNIIHKDINPSNIIWNPETNKLKIIDFGISAVIPHEIAAAQSPEVLEGTLAYISPEKTGRMNRMMDYRTDLYSLGVTLYEMFTGQLPFPCKNALELIHCHIAKDPVPPDRIRPANIQFDKESGEMISGIILKLMSKNAEERYQNAFGLKADLDICLVQLQTTGKIKDFEIARHDFSDRFQIPQKLYGRAAEIEILLNSFGRICRGTKELIMVTGYAGIGKSLLINEIHKPILTRHGYFISGKYSQFERNIPYLGLIQAFQQLIKHILTEKEGRIEYWEKKILRAVGPNARIIIDVIPELELIIGKQPAVPELPSQEAQNRFSLTFQNFIRIFAGEKHPLAIFLDDIHWIDLPSLKLIKLFLTDTETKYMLFIGAYRDNELASDHPLLTTLNEINKAGITLSRLILPALDHDHVNQLLSETLKCQPVKTTELASLCKKRTLGNPFFLKQFLRALYKEKLIEFDNRQMVWHWEIDRIGRMGITENVVDLMVNKTRKLSPATQTVLQIAACIGNQFKLKTLAMVYEKTPAETAKCLYEALQEEFVLPMSDAYKFIQEDFEDVEVIYKFTHDRIQQAVYSMIDENQKKIYHLHTGNLLLNNTPEEKLEEDIFEIVNHLDAGIDLIKEPSLEINLAGLNLIAGRKAKAANAYEPSMKYLSTGIELLGSNCWKDNYLLTLDLVVETADVSFLLGDYEKMEMMVKIGLDHTEVILERIRIYEIIIQSLIARARLPEALNTATGILNQLGVSISKKPSRLFVMFNVFRLQVIMNRIDIEDLKRLPEMTDPKCLAAMRILFNAASSAYRNNILMAINMALKMIQLSVRYGNSPYSPFSYSVYSIVIQGVVGDIEKAYKLGKFPLELVARFRAKESSAKINAIFNLFIRHWKDPLKDTIEPLNETFKVGLETGDLEFAAYCIMYSSVHALFCGKELEIVNAEMEEKIELVKKLKQERTLFNMQFHRQFVLNMIGYAANRTELTGESFDEEKMLPFLRKTNDFASKGVFITDKTIISYMFGENREALKYALELEKYRRPLIGLFYLPLVCFYSSLVFLSYIPESGWQKRRLYLRKTKRNQRAMQKWASHAPSNHLHKWYLVEAERSRVLSKERMAMEYYDKAIEAARENEYLIEEALSNELAGVFYYSAGSRRTAKAYMTEACNLYKRWGALAKVDYLNEKYPELLAKTTDETGKEANKSDFKVGTGTILSEKLDLTSILKASRAISCEIHLGRLLEKLMNIVIANAGAQKGFLLLTEGEELYLEGEAYAKNEEVSVLQHTPVLKVRDISQLIINYVLRISETVVINDASVEQNFSGDDYIIANKPKSIFCMPLIYQNRISGILYLENNIAIGAFTPERLKMLEMLTGEIIMSIENAKLYRNLQEYNRTLEEKVKIRTEEISQKNEQLNLQKEELGETLKNLRLSQFQLLQSEKMASLGQLVAGIAHEINNPVTFISAGIDSLKTNIDEILQVLDLYHKVTPGTAGVRLPEIEKLKEKIEYGQALSEVRNLLDIIKTGTERTTEIIKGLRSFSRMEEDILKVADIHENLNTALILLRNKYRDRITIVKEYGDIPQIECYPGLLNQVFMNILTNAIDAIEDKGEISIRTSKANQMIRIAVRDTGTGMSEKIRPKIFEPFFTTKEVGQGTGLGLSISHGIIEKHGGRIDVISSIGKGSEFIISLPIKQSH
jgi:predicted ATPase/signal transduction histidine kinase/tRNA A-37 threonylcarbamoyl transferase component Bud32